MNQLIVFPFFGEKYKREFLACLETIPKYWEILVISDREIDGVNQIIIDSPGSSYEMMVFRKRIPDYVNINNYARIWHCDPDVLFTGDLLEKYSAPPWEKYIIVSQEPFTPIDNYHMGAAFPPDELEYLRLNRAPAINGGLIGVPRTQSDFWEYYGEYIDQFHAGNPDIQSTDQLVLNIMYHRRAGLFALTDMEDIGFPTRDTRGKLMNHYIGYYPDKYEMMRRDL